MIFISYRHEDTKAEVTNLHRRLVERFGEEQVFVDYRDIPPGEKWPETLQQKLEESCVLLAVIGSKWSDARFTTGKRRGRLRLDDPGDWVRQEICTAIRRGSAMRVIVVPIDDTMLPETEWGCELDQLSNYQQARLRNQIDFEKDFINLCGWLEKQIPELKRIAESRRKDFMKPQLLSMSADSSDQVFWHYIATELQRHVSIQLPLVSQSGQPVVAPISELRIDLPLIVSHEHSPISSQAALLWLGREVLSIHDQFRSTHTSALLVDRASRFEDIRRDCDIGDRLGPGRRLVIVGDPGCGKSTLLQWLAHYYASLLAARLRSDNAPVVEPQSMPANDWLPVLILCRDFAGQPLPTQFAELLCTHLKLRQFSDTIITSLVPGLEHLLEQGRVILLIDGLDEIPITEQRIEFCRLLTSIANRFPGSPVVVTSRVVGFQVVRDELASKYDHIVVGPLDRAAKLAFIERWSKLAGWGVADTAGLVQQVCYSRVTAKLTENIFLLAMVAQIQILDRRLPGRRVDVYRRAVQLMIQRCRPFAGPRLSVNEVIPHLEFLAYRMRRKGVQRCSDMEVLEAFRELRRLEPDEPVLQTRVPEELLSACIDSLGLLNLAGTETDRRGFDRQVIQFFHQSFQEYFAGQAINHGHDAAGGAGAVARLRELLSTIEVREREVEIFGNYKIVEFVIADYWQEAVRMGIADLKPEEADDAILMLLPSPLAPPREARPQAVFALQCLADEPQVSEPTVSAVFDAVIDCLEEGDVFNSGLHTWMDEALAAVSESAFGMQLRDRLINDFIRVRGEQRRHIGCCVVLRSSGGGSIVTSENAEAMVLDAIQGLASNQQVERVRTALNLMDRCYLSGGNLGFLTLSQQERIIEALVATFSRDEATVFAVMWALFWLTGAGNRTRGNKRSEPLHLKPTEAVILLDAARIREIERTLRRSDLDIYAKSYGYLILTREKGLDPVVHQFDWIYELARIADGEQPRRSLFGPAPTGRVVSTEWLQDLLKQPLPVKIAIRIAQALGSFGVYIPDMVDSLCYLFRGEEFDEDSRDEALVYLSLIGNSEVARTLIEAADTSPVGNDDYLYLRGLFGLLLLDNVDILSEQLRKDLGHSDLNAYAYGLAGSRDPRGRVLLEELSNDTNERVRTAVAKAFTRTWMATE